MNDQAPPSSPEPPELKNDQAPHPSLEPPVLMNAKTSGAAVASLALGIISMCCFGPLTGIPAVILGIVALSAIAQSQGLLKGRGMAIGGIVLGAVSIVMIGIMAAIMLPALARAREAARRSSCQNNMKQVALVFKLYANENRDLWPFLSPVKGRLMFSDEKNITEYLTDFSILHCPSSFRITFPEALEDPINDQSYLYLGYVLEDEAQLRLFAEAYKSPDFDPTQDIQVPEGQGNGGSSVIYRLREGVERFLIEDIHQPSAYMQSRIPVFMDRPSLVNGELVFNHVPQGGNVAFMDGHVEWISYPSAQKFPMTRESLKILYELASLDE